MKTWFWKKVHQTNNINSTLPLFTGNNSANVNNLLNNHKWNELAELLQLWKIWSINLKGKQMSFDIVYDWFCNLLVSHNADKGKNTWISWLELWDNLESLVKVLIEKEQEYIDLEFNYTKTLEKIPEEDKDFFDKLIGDVKISFNNHFIDWLLTTANFEALQKSLQRTYSVGLNWNLANWKWFDIKYDIKSHTFKAYNFENYETEGKNYWENENLKALLKELYENYAK